jgi:hypothetical protein
VDTKLSLTFVYDMYRRHPATANQNKTRRGHS